MALSVCYWGDIWSDHVHNGNGEVHSQGVVQHKAEHGQQVQHLATWQEVWRGEKNAARLIIESNAIQSIDTSEKAKKPKLRRLGHQKVKHLKFSSGIFPENRKSGDQRLQNKAHPKTDTISDNKTLLYVNRMWFYITQKIRKNISMTKKF